MDNQIVIGVDGGGTRLRAALVSTTGELLGRGEAGSGNYHDVGVDAVRTNLDHAITSAWDDAGRPAQGVDAIFLGLGSITTPEDRATIRSLVRDLAIVPEDKIGVDHDLRVALTGGLGGEPGIVLIAGTGSSCYGRDRYGNTWQAGGWGATLDDPGSSFWMGRQAMIAAIREFDGRGPATVLTVRVCEALELPDLRHILRLVELQGMARSAVAALARLVTDSADDGDAVARAIIDQGACELATMVGAVAAGVEEFKTLSRIPVVVTGGLTGAGATFMDPLLRALERQVPSARVQDAIVSPVLGAALLAIELLDQPRSASVVSRLAQELSTPAGLGMKSCGS
jgi:glucosamine kinase